VVRRLERPIFVVGCPRSGTTLVQCILSASSGAFSLPETHFFSWVLPMLGVSTNGEIDGRQIARARAELENEAQLSLPADFWSRLDSRRDLTAVDLFCEIVEHFRPATGPRVIEKTPRHVLHLETIGEAFPDAVFINVVRDPVDVASSLLAVPFESSRSLLSYAQRWLESVDAAEMYARRHPGRLFTVVYERLTRGPEEEVRQLCQFVDLAYEVRMLEEFGREAARNVAGNEPWKRDVSTGVILNRSGVWRSRMTPGQAWLVAQSTHHRAAAFGYDGAPRAALGSIVAALAHEARVRYREARSSEGLVGAARHAGSVLKTLSAA
jgi:hypothetical protein